MKTRSKKRNTLECLENLDGYNSSEELPVEKTIEKTIDVEISDLEDDTGSERDCTESEEDEASEFNREPGWGPLFKDFNAINEDNLKWKIYTQFRRWNDSLVGGRYHVRFLTPECQRFRRVMTFNGYPKTLCDAVPLFRSFCSGNGYCAAKHISSRTVFKGVHIFHVLKHVHRGMLMNEFDETVHVYYLSHESGVGLRRNAPGSMTILADMMLREDVKMADINEVAASLPAVGSLVLSACTRSNFSDSIKKTYDSIKFVVAQPCNEPTKFDPDTDYIPLYELALPDKRVERYVEHPEGCERFKRLAATILRCFARSPDRYSVAPIESERISMAVLNKECGIWCAYIECEDIFLNFDDLCSLVGEMSHLTIRTSYPILVFTCLNGSLVNTTLQNLKNASEGCLKRRWMYGELERQKRKREEDIERVDVEDSDEEQIRNVLDVCSFFIEDHVNSLESGDSSPASLDASFDSDE
jgi:hypothetical protein